MIINGTINDDGIVGTPGNDIILGGNGNDIIDGGEGNDYIEGESGNDSILGGAGNDALLGGSGNDTIRGGEGDDFINGQDGDDKLYGDNGNDAILGGNGNDIIDGGEGNDYIEGESGNDSILGGAGNDALFGGSGDIQANSGNDTISGGEGNDFINGQDGDDKIYGDNGNNAIVGGNDAIVGGNGNDIIDGGTGDDSIFGDDTLLDEHFDSAGYLFKATVNSYGNDFLKGGNGNDVITASLGSDTLSGENGNDIITSISDSNIPAENKNNVPIGATIADLVFDPAYFNPDGLQANDILIGGAGSDTFEFKLLINAGVDIYEKHIQSDGTIDWMGVAGENNNYHDHWVDGIGSDTIMDFSGTGGQGDKINIIGHTVTYKVLSSTATQVKLGLYSDQGADGKRGTGAHDLDVLGIVTVNHDGHFNIANDVAVQTPDIGSFSGVVGGEILGTSGNNTIVGGRGQDRILGLAGNDALYGDTPLLATDFDSNGYLKYATINTSAAGSDKLNGGQGNDTLESALGSDTMMGGSGDDLITSLSDSNIPKQSVAVGATISDLVFDAQFFNPDGLKANDTLIGDTGSDTFEFKLLINAKESIYKQHLQTGGIVDWMGVAGENNNYHDHWVEGIGNDTIMDFSGNGGEGDKITIIGHTVAVKVIDGNGKISGDISSINITNGIDGQIRLGVYSDQGADGKRGNGAHDLDLLGIVTVNHTGKFIGSDITILGPDIGSFVSA
ncbi:calcium-binding protein [Aphanizomenon flos-aquae FACHB-1287]|uniref:calcium-binding protein n=1 Tax=Aphanizomenon flos-aquae TaxID=1176 RepID=UPI001688D290|nr:calcium-binding protein [Aphanizomenon flos-aquae]MBD2695710.1 calcium-binding protein [Aphanizomenon flos-aquae FACHB-1287]